MNYTSIKNIDNLSQWVQDALEIKRNPLKNKKLGKKQNLRNVVFQSKFKNPVEYAKSSSEFGNERDGNEFYQ